jgi:alpha-D-ribose 1-methylphosphonate 5-triphosphate synthase subunit PhnH
MGKRRGTIVDFDYIHHIQKAYRKLVDSIAKPGAINSLKAVSDRLDLPVRCNKSTLVLALMLLDTEVTFHIIGNDSEQLAKYISQLTYAKVAPGEEADFIFLLEESEPGQFAKIIQRCKLGDLINPHTSATLIVEVKKIAAEKRYILTGPGIKEEKYLSIDHHDNWTESRIQKNSEYPLGIEIYFIDQEHNLVAIPRTTMIKEAASSEATSSEATSSEATSF